MMLYFGEKVAMLLIKVVKKGGQRICLVFQKNNRRN